MNSSYKKWRNTFVENEKAKKRAVWHRLQTERECFNKWVVYYKREKEDKRKIAKALDLYERNWVKKLGSTFQSWVLFKKFKKHSKQVLEAWAQRRQKKVYKKVIWEFQVNRLQSLKEKHLVNSKKFNKDKVKFHCKKVV